MLLDVPPELASLAAAFEQKGRVAILSELVRTVRARLEAAAAGRSSLAGDFIDVLGAMIDREPDPLAGDEGRPKHPPPRLV